MNKQQFLASRSKDWEQFRELLRRRESELKIAKPSEFSRLLRAVSHDLAVIRSRDWGRDLETYLNDLVTRGHNEFYSAPARRWGMLLSFLLYDFPRNFRRHQSYFWIASLAFFGPFILSAILVALQPELASRVLPGAALEQFDEMYSESHSGGELRASMAGFYVYNNVGIAFRCFALGILFGLGTLTVLLFNGIYLGTVTGYLVAQGHSENFFSFVVSHGSFELVAIAVAGGAGLMLGHSLVHPGPYKRWDALKLQSREAIHIALGAGAMLGVAALIEAFWSPSAAPPLAKYIVGGILWIVVFAYLGLAGRGRSVVPR